MDERIRLSSTDSVNSVDKKNFLDVDVQRHTRSFPFPSLSYTIDQREQFEKERSESTKYRLILTINPYCSNILFNAVTEIVQNEGTDKPDDLNIATSEGIVNAKNGMVKPPIISGYNIRGKIGDASNPLTNTDMVRNTEYSNGTNPFVYHCGYDIFNNHILRNQTFKLVNPLTNLSENNQIHQKDTYNTINDYMRYSDGSNVHYAKRNDINDTKLDQLKHLYLKDDILSIIDSINFNLSEENGWWGFNNRSMIKSCEYNNNEKKWDDLKISKVFNTDDLGCGFIEMYPDSTLYSFNPKYNEIQRREEFNWDICITYPYDKDDKKILVCGQLENEDGDFNALLLASYEQINGPSGKPILLFRSYVKHNLHVGDEIKLFYAVKNNDGIGSYKEIEDRVFKVVNTGNMKEEHLEYYFYINDVDDVLEEIGETDETISDKYCFRFIKVVNNRDCNYYYRKFRKLPNFKFKKEELTDEIINDRSKLEEYINNNCKINTDQLLPFSSEIYPLAFSKTIYGDTNTQVVYTDTIDIDKLTDNLGRPLTELFITILKRNKGHDLWYKKVKTENNLKDIEFSHCFGELISGLDIHDEITDDNTDNFILTNRLSVGDICLLNNSNKDDNALDLDIDINKDEFYGDVVELNCYEMTETVLSDVYFRFNTEQREHDFSDDELKCNTFIYDEIITDDYDLGNFETIAYDMDCINYDGGFSNDNKNQCNCDNTSNNKKSTTYRPEGYFYKAHYPFLVREFGTLKQGSHYEIMISSCKITQSNGLFVEIVSTLASNVIAGDIIYLCDDEAHISIPLFVNSTISNVRFLVSPMIPGDENYKSVFEIVEGLLHSDSKTITQDDIEAQYTWVDEYGIKHVARNKIIDTETNEIVIPSDIGKKVYDYSKPKYILRIKNTDIPSYAYEVATNLYMWRDLLTVGDKNTYNLKEYPFANGHFYVNKEINFFLKRQDPFGYNELYDEYIIPNDIAGNIKKQDNYEYKDETHRVC